MFVSALEETCDRLPREMKTCRSLGTASRSMHTVNTDTGKCWGGGGGGGGVKSNFQIG